MTCIDLPYDVVYCTSQDDDYPVYHLSEVADAKEAEHKGWQSARFGKIPQTLVLRFHGNVWLQQIRILSHETKISSKVEIRVFQLKKDMLDSPPSFRGARFTKLGAVEFNTNEQSNYRSKERKTVHLKTEAYFLKLLFDKPYTNSYNTGQQVGVYLIECSGYIVNSVGEHVDRALTSSLALPPRHEGHDAYPNGGANTRPLSPFSSAAPPMVEQGFPRPTSEVPNLQSVSPPPLPGDGFNSYRSLRILDFEEFFIRRAEELISLKEQALQVQDMALARVCRDKLNQLNGFSKDIYRLEQEKVQSIIREDFDEAKQARDSMNAIIDKAIKEAQIPDPTHMDAGDVRGAAAPPHAPSSEEEPAPPSDWLAVRAGKGSEDAAKDKEKEHSADSTAKEVDRSDTIDVVHEDGQLIQLSELSEVHCFIGELILQQSGESAEELFAPTVSYDTTLLYTCIGPAATACLFSKKFRLREFALLEIKNELSNSLRDSCASVEDCVLRFLDLNSYGLQDTFPNVFVAACAFVQAVLDDPCDCLAAVLAPAVALIPRLMTRACDAQTRVREEAFYTLNRYVQTPSVQPATLLNAVIADPVDKDRRKLPNTHARAQTVRLSFLQLIVDEDRLSLTAATSEKDFERTTYSRCQQRQRGGTRFVVHASVQLGAERTHYTEGAPLY
ncbi:hypothetical protein STCU_06835 [Strigomonas culicis]|uniref:Centrosomal protein CEP104 N-terminal domain-containing protein n=1 Tax=Strigomonas culicis TaxID=28005 RepID=S9VPE5_9TRYP|nr:hypothetical protein STCU_06835 [Strigomonas culicis]|eukprot:EPY25115.1 hypothetical protein STCU_06835 [Strigomonas culicis]